MIEIKGKHANAIVYTDHLDQGAKDQISRLMDQSFVEGSKVRIMPDVHSGMGCVIGFTANMGDKLVPNLVGVDIGCGVLVVNLGQLYIDFELLDTIIRQRIPTGFKVHTQRQMRYPKLQELHIYRDLKDSKRLERSLGTLGGGNHFIELGQDSEENIYLQIHSGSRNLGHQVATIYQNKAIDYHKEQKTGLAKDLAYLVGDQRKAYLHDMKICQDFAVDNRNAMADCILDGLFSKSIEDFDYFHTVHNYIDFVDNIIRKGAVSAYEGQDLIIPINMKDGSILARGKGNSDWNYSAPHGAGRLMSRKEAKNTFNLDELKEEMRGVYTTSLSKSTLDEDPKAYRNMEEILNKIEDTVEVVDILKPIYNFKA